MEKAPFGKLKVRYSDISLSVTPIAGCALTWPISTQGWNPHEDLCFNSGQNKVLGILLTKQAHPQTEAQLLALGCL